jgi:hypothetical protein
MENMGDKETMRKLWLAGGAMLALAVGPHVCTYEEGVAVDTAKPAAAEQAPEDPELTEVRSITKIQVQDTGYVEDKPEPPVDPDWELQKKVEEMDGGKEQIKKIKEELVNRGYSLPDEDNPFMEKIVLEAIPGEVFTIEKDGYRASIQIRLRYDGNDEVYWEGEMNYYLGWDEEESKPKTARKNISSNTDAELLDAIDAEMAKYINQLQSIHE